MRPYTARDESHMADILWRSLQALYDHALPRKAFWRLAYEWIAGEQPDAFALMNYGYIADPAAARPPTTDEALCLDLYRHVAGAVPLEGKDLLEVGAGRGGGLAHVKQRLRPRAAFGIDLSSRAVSLARRSNAHVKGLSFLSGDAEQLPFGEETFDAVLNVESSHCYPSRLRFYQEVRRVLRPGGHFLYADFFEAGELQAIREALWRARLRIDAEEDITENVLAALRVDEARKLRLIARAAPRMRATFRNFAATTDSDTYRLLDTGARRYLRFALGRANSPEASSFGE
jgi:SAM-dependent methyltransferase